MMRRSVLLLGCLILGLAAGHTLKRQPGNADPSRTSDQGNPSSRKPASPKTASHLDSASLPSDLRSNDTIEDLLALSRDDLYERLALWLVDASLQDIASYWEATKNHKEVPIRILDLLFVRWTQMDAHGAVAAVEGTRHASILWSAWAKNDPISAFNHIMAHDRSQAANVLRAIGLSDPQLALDLLDAHPNLNPFGALDGVLIALAREDPAAAVKVAAERGSYPGNEAISAWLREDPHAAFDWFLANRIAGSSFTDHNDGTFIASLARQNPSLLAEFAAKVPPGKLRDRIEFAAFDQLILQDPDQALAKARSNPSPAIALGQFTRLALHLGATDPAKSRLLLAEIIGRQPDFLKKQNHIVLPTGSTSLYQSNDGEGELVEQLVQDLVKSEPRSTLNQLIGATKGNHWNQTTQTIAKQWMQKDPAAFEDWLIGLESLPARDEGYRNLIQILQSKRDFESAIRHAANLTEPAEAEQTRSYLIMFWQAVDPAAARQWAAANGINLENR